MKPLLSLQAAVQNAVVQLGKFLVAQRNKNGLTLFSLCTRTGLSPEEYTAVESGRQIASPAFLDTICGFYQVHPADIFSVRGGSNRKPKSWSEATCKAVLLRLVKGPVPSVSAWAKASGVNRLALSSIVTGTVAPNLEQAARLAASLGEELYEFLAGAPLHAQSGRRLAPG